MRRVWKVLSIVGYSLLFFTVSIAVILDIFVLSVIVCNLWR